MHHRHKKTFQILMDKNENIRQIGCIMIHFWFSCDMRLKHQKRINFFNAGGEKQGKRLVLRDNNILSTTMSSKYHPYLERTYKNVHDFCHNAWHWNAEQREKKYWGRQTKIWIVNCGATAAVVTKTTFTSKTQQQQLKLVVTVAAHKILCEVEKSCGES